MTKPSFIRKFVPALTLAAVALSAAPPAAFAGSVKGTVRLPDGGRGGRMHQGFWRLENGNVPVKPGGKGTAVVVLTGISGQHAPSAKTVTVEIAGLDAQPRLVVIGPGSVVEFKNVGKITHELSMPADVSTMPVERLNPGTHRHQKFNAPGGYLVRCSEYPHLAISVIVVDSPYYSIVDEKGGFQIPAGVPDGKATLKVWSLGRWVHEESIDATGKQDLTVRVAAPKGAKDVFAKEAEPKESDSAEGKESESTGSSEQ
jgi:plastocyanin